MNEEPTYEQLLRQYKRVELENERLRTRARRKRRILSRQMKILVLAAVILLVGPALAITLFSQTMSFTPPAAAIVSNCPTPADAVLGNMIVFTCSGTPTAPLTVPASSSGSVTYSGFSWSPSQPGAIADAYLIDSGATLATTCASTTGTGVDPLPLAFGGGSLTIGGGTGQLKPSHLYSYCLDATSLPTAFTFTVSWSQ